MENIVTLSGSPSLSSRLSHVLEFVHDRLAENGFQADWIRVRDLPPEDLIYARYDSPAIEQANALISKASAVIVASPVYKASYTGVLKTFLDLIPQGGLRNKIVLPLLIGGTSAHLLAIEYALKPVLSTLGARTILQGVYVLESQVQRDGDKAELHEDIQVRLEDAIHELTEALSKQTLPNG
ncbi:FMN reductase (NADPH) [Collibacillus ludicampi]|uniref:FMN reductase (NADPH) n=1 Tax=Collibacillus ludicampi TaxID=2771369 RepID=A0AAV4LBI4_9BACL|nr:NADPH-dependent FMN reductase [Collibacillus ludicampi]GIM45175.1 FMN reductase (NADPH) [Collibacillus ludicampi]